MDNEEEGSRLWLRLIDLTLLLLLSLMVHAGVVHYDVELPISRAQEDAGLVPYPIEAVVTADGSIIWKDLAGDYRILLLPQLVEMSVQSQRSVELRVDGRTPGQRLLEIHRALEAEGRPLVFVVERK